MKALGLFRSNGEIVRLHGVECSLEQAQEFVRSGADKSYIENVPMEDKKAFLVHEEGLLYNLPVNLLASQMAGKQLVGDVLYVEYEDKDFE